MNDIFFIYKLYNGIFYRNITIMNNCIILQDS